jgi:carbamoyl-phosphate synthase small subunit
MKGFLQLGNGDCFQGNWLTGSPDGEVKGEIVFYTGMTGYQEVLTDPSYKDKIVVFTYPLIGNYGITEMKFESEKPHVAGVIVYEAKRTAFHYEAKNTLVDYLQKWGIPMLGHIDTRAVVKKIRTKGSITACMTSLESEQAQPIELQQNTEKVTQATA